MGTYLFVNARSGRGKQADLLEKFLTAARALPGVEVCLLQPDTPVADLVRQQLESGCTQVAAAGGDGTLSTVADAIAGKSCKFTPIPFGTENHFCRDLGVVSDPIEALAALQSAAANVVERTIDVGCVNGRHFLDNSSLGLYPHLVKRRLAHHDAIGKWPAYFIAALEVAMHPVRLKLALPGSPIAKPTSVGLLFVSNNRMKTTWPEVGIRPRLDEGILQTYILKGYKPWTILRAASHLLRGHIRKSPLLEKMDSKGFEVRVKGKHSVRVSADGEIFHTSSPIKYEIKPRALAVRYVAEHEKESTSP